MGTDAPAESVQQQRVSGNFFNVLGVKPALGRLLTEADDDPANTQAGAVISYEFWNRRFGLDPSVVGRPIAVNDKALTIVGVAPRGFFGFDVGTRPELWWPIRAMDDPNLGRESSGWIRAIGRLRPGATMAQAQAEVEVVFRRQIEEVARAFGQLDRAAAAEPFRARAQARAGRCRLHETATAVSAAADDRDDHGGPGAVDCVREPREPDARARHRAAQRDCGAVRARRGAPAPACANC